MINRPRPVKPRPLDGVRLAVLVNPSAGSRQGMLRAARAVAVLKEAGALTTVLSAAEASTLAAMADDAASSADALVAVGGDGMVQAGAEAALRSGLPLGIIPAGTGNDAARALGVPRRGDAAVHRFVAVWAIGGRAVDVARVDLPDGAVRHYVTALAAGFDAVVNRQANEWTRPRGTLRYVAAIFRRIGGFRPVHYRLRVDGVTEETDAVILTVANGSSFGGGLRIAPRAVPDDGMLDLVTVAPISRLLLVLIFPLAFLGLHVLHPAVTVRRVREVRLESGGPVCHADGEALAAPPLSVTVLPGALRVLV